MSVMRPESALATPIASEMSLLVDIGSAWTKAALIARSRGRWRIVAHVAQPTAWGDEELRRSIAAHLRHSADRRVTEALEDLLAGAPRISAHTPRRAGRIAVTAVSEELSGASALRAAESAGWTVQATATADDGRSIAERLSALQAAEVDAWLLSGGFEQGRSDQALEMASLVAVARNGSGGPVVWAGASGLVDEVRELFEADAVSVVANPRPSATAEELGPLRHALEELLQRVVEPARTRQHSPVAFRRAVAQLARSTIRRVAAVDVGARYLTWVTADEEGNAESRVFATGGLAAARLVATGGPGRLARWLPIAVDELAVADALQNLHARPATLPQTEDELVILHAAVRQLLAQTAADGASAMEQLGGADLLIGSGRTIAAAPRPAQAAQLLVDGVRPLGVTQLALDAAGVLAPLGALEDGEIAEGMGALRDDLLVPIGSAVVCRGGRPGQPAMRVWIRRAGWPEIGPIELRGGQLQIVPLARGHDAEIEVELLNGATLGGDQGGRVRSSVAGGLVGLILDARGIPLALPRRSDDRRAVLAGWRDTFLREASMPVSEPPVDEEGGA